LELASAIGRGSRRRFSFVFFVVFHQCDRSAGPVFSTALAGYLPDDKYKLRVATASVFKSSKTAGHPPG